MKKPKKIALIIATVVLMAVCFIFGASAERAVVISGDCGAEGDNVTWVLYDDGEIVFSGEGAMEDYASELDDNGSYSIHSSDWYDYYINKVTIESGITHIGSGAFYGFNEEKNQIATVVIPDTVNSIGNSAFRDCKKLSNITIPDGVTEIKHHTFYSCESLESIDIPDSVVLIGESAFYNCKKLAEISIPDGVTEIKGYVFAYCESLKSIEIPDSVVGIGEDAFSYCVSFTEFVIPKGVTAIKDRAFLGCYNLASITIPNSVKTIGKRCFAFCENLENITLTEGVTTIDSSAFDGCIKLKNIFIPASVTYIGYSAFSEAISLESIIVDENNAAYSSDENGVLFDKDKTKLICYPAGSKTTEYLVPSTVETICSMSFFSVLYLEKIKLPDNLKKIEEESFGYNFGLTEITIPASVESICGVGMACNNFVDRIVVEAMNVELDTYSMNPTQFEFFDITQEEIIELYKKILLDGDEEAMAKISEHILYTENIIHLSTIYCHSGSTAETYAIENGVKYELTHFFKGEWTYDYDNMIRTRKCIHCDELQVEALEIDEISGDSFLVIEETVTNGIEGNAEVLKAFDINLKNGDGVHVQPDGTIKVKLPNDWSKNGVYKVYRVNDDGTLTDMNAYREGSHLVFETDHFSIYVIVVETEETEPEEPDTPVVPDTPEEPTEPEESECRCFCHMKGDFFELLVIIFKFVIKIVGVAPLCDCGIAHY